MMNKSNSLLFTMIILLSVPISISSNSWFVVWIGMEINMMAFMPIIIEKNNIMSKESSLTYFMTQTIASMLMMMAIIIMMINNNKINMNMSYMGELIMTSALMIKSGMAPFHFWMPKMMEGLSWNKCLILMTWQKITSLMMMSNIIKINYITLLMMILSVIVGAIGGLNQTSLRKMMAYSSINNNGWMMAAMLMSDMMWMLYFMIYSLMMMIMTFSMNMYKNYHINQIVSMKESSLKKFLLMINMLSISGLPPMLGFLPKWLVIQSTMMYNEFMLMLIMMIMTLITVYYYLRIMFSVMMLSSTESKWVIMMAMPNNKIMLMNSLSVMGLTLITLIIMLK